jgi:hypothetical protein
VACVGRQHHDGNRDTKHHTAVNTDANTDPDVDHLDIGNLRVRVTTDNSRRCARC